MNLKMDAIRSILNSCAHAIILAEKNEDALEKCFNPGSWDPVTIQTDTNEQALG